ncbi:MAG: hypothetical protein C5S43_04800 [Candidatus Methanocomedens sp.]|nr:MAG: hypothetical protein C5S43_04800 [ANME-2 cluster archaeon]
MRGVCTHVLSFGTACKIEKLKHDPISHDSKIVEGYSEKLFRVRVGDYRILYEVDYNGNLIGIIKIDKRSRVY